MLPDNKLSATPLKDLFIVPQRTSLFIDYCIHPETKKLITSSYVDSVFSYKHDGIVTEFLSVLEVTSMSFTLDLNLRPVLVYVLGGDTYMYWFNSAIGKMDTTNWGVQYKDPQVALDEDRVENSNQADVIFAYIRDGQLCVRNQRDRFTLQTILSPTPRLKQIGMLKNYRFGFDTYTRIRPKDM